MRSQRKLYFKDDMSTLGTQIVREIVIPELTKEVNENKNFAQLRQVYNSLILATWYKKKIKDSILEQVYADKNKVAGINIDDPQEKQRIYQRYLQAFKKGAFNYIKDDIDSTTQQIVPRKYFSGGESFTAWELDSAMSVTTDSAELGDQKYGIEIKVGLTSAVENPNEQIIQLLQSSLSFGKQPFSKFESWMNEIADRVKNPLTDAELDVLAAQMGLDTSLVKSLRIKAAQVANGSHAFYQNLSRDGKVNVYLFRDAFGLYMAERTAGKKPLAMLVSKSLIQSLGSKTTGLAILAIINEAKESIGLNSNEIKTTEQFTKFKSRFFELFDAILYGKGIDEVSENNKMIIKNNMVALRQIVFDLSKYAENIGITTEMVRDNGIRFIDTTRRGTFVLLMEAVIREKFGINNIEDKTDSRMFYSSLAQSMSALDINTQVENARMTELDDYPIEYDKTSTIGTNGINEPNVIFTKDSTVAKKFIFFTVAYRSELLKRGDLKNNVDGSRDLDQAMIGDSVTNYGEKPQRFYDEKFALLDSSTEIGFILDLILDRTRSIAIDKENIGPVQISELTQKLSSINDQFKVDIGSEDSFEVNSKLLRLKKKKRDMLYADREKAFANKEYKGFKRARIMAEFNRNAINLNQEIMKLQILVALTVLEGKSKLPSIKLYPNAVILTLEGALQSNQFLRQEFVSRLGRLKAIQRIRKIETRNWLEQIVGTYNLWAFDIKVEKKAEENSGKFKVTVPKRTYINVHTQLRSILSKVRQFKFPEAIQILENLKELYRVQYFKGNENYTNIFKGLKDLENTIKNFPENEKPTKETLNLIRGNINDIIQLVIFPKRYQLQEIDYEDPAHTFRGYVHRFESHSEDIQVVSNNMNLIKFYMRLLSDAVSQKNLGDYQQEQMINDLNDILKWAQNGDVKEKVTSSNKLSAAIEDIKNGVWAAAQSELKGTVDALQIRLNTINRIEKAERGPAASAFAKYREVDSISHIDGALKLLEEGKLSEVLRQVTELINLYYQAEPVEPGLKRARNGFRYIENLLQKDQSIDQKDKIKEYLEAIKDDIKHKTSLRILLTQKGAIPRYVFPLPNISVQGFLKSHSIIEDKIKIVIFRKNLDGSYQSIEPKDYTQFKIEDRDQIFVDKAMNVLSLKTNGGIDLNSSKMNLLVQNSGQGIRFHIDPAMLQQLKDAPGFVPVIINIRPLTNIRTFLGLTANQ